MTRLAFALAAVPLFAACGSSSSDSSTPAASLDCATYCAQMAATCTGTDVQYTGLTGTCETYCGTTNAWPAGTPGATGDTLACRIDHANNAAASKVAGNAAQVTAHCGHAGPSGGNVCGSWCQDYCDLALKNCTGANAAGLGFTDNTTCLAACGGLANTGAINLGSGNTVQCRIYHAGAASASPTPHCGHAQIVSSGTVGGTTANGPCN